MTPADLEELRRLLETPDERMCNELHVLGEDFGWCDRCEEWVGEEYQRLLQVESFARRMLAEYTGAALSREVLDAIVAFGKWGRECREREEARRRRVRCNRHDDCEAVNRAADAAGKRRPDHCHSDDCEECFGS